MLDDDSDVKLIFNILSCKLWNEHYDELGRNLRRMQQLSGCSCGAF